MLFIRVVLPLPDPPAMPMTRMFSMFFYLRDNPLKIGSHHFQLYIFNFPLLFYTTFPNNARNPTGFFRSDLTDTAAPDPAPSGPAIAGPP
jgi:hypothetical protein